MIFVAPFLAWCSALRSATEVVDGENHAETERATPIWTKIAIAAVVAVVALIAFVAWIVHIWEISPA